MKNSITQQTRVWNYLVEEGSITPLDAMREFGIMRLSAIIFNLRKERVIITTYETKKNRYGNPVTYARYVLPKE